MFRRNLLPLSSGRKVIIPIRQAGLCRLIHLKLYFECGHCVSESEACQEMWLCLTFDKERKTKMLPRGRVVSATLMASGTFLQINGPSWEPGIQLKKLLTNWPLTCLSDERPGYDRSRNTRRIFIEFGQNTWQLRSKLSGMFGPNKNVITIWTYLLSSFMLHSVRGEDVWVRYGRKWNKLDSWMSLSRDPESNPGPFNMKNTFEAVNRDMRSENDQLCGGGECY